MPQNEFDNLLEKYLQGSCTAEEDAIVLEWVSKLLATSKVELTVKEKEIIEFRVWSKISNNLFAHKQTKNTSSVISIWYKHSINKIAIAASILVVLGFGVLYFANKTPKDSVETANHKLNLPKGYNLFENSGTQTQQLGLPDGSIVKLKAKSTLYYPIVFVGATRDVYLEGSAFFEVTHDPMHHFIVHSNAVETEVLGTSFGITKDSKTNKIEVAVATGKVSVYEKSKKITLFNATQPNGIVLTPNERATYNPSNSQFVTTLVEEPLPLLKLQHKPDTLQFEFQEATLYKVFSALQAAYGITINVEKEKINSCHFTGDITKQDLYNKLDIVCQSTQTSYELKGTTIFIKGNGCD